MPFSFSRISAKLDGQRPLDPIEIFQSATISDPGINDLWLAQGDALRDWHAARAKPDVAVVLNTGAGKTLVGLLVAQSLVNENSGHVVYACGSIQLIEQTAAKAAGYGLEVATYHSGSFSNDSYTRGLAPCITTYQALFNGKSRFFSEELTAVVFDDAHIAEHLLRDHFSLSISRSLFPDSHAQLVALFKAYHDATGRASSYSELESASSDSVFYVPPFEVAANINAIRAVLTSAGLDDKKETKFSWLHIRDREDLCAFFVSSDAVTLTPPVIPVDSLPYFRKSVRRVYLSATLAAPDSFARTFGRLPSHIIAPSTTAGECERLILFPSKTGLSGKDTAIAKTLTSGRKALILVPTYRRAKVWEDIAKPPAREKTPDAVESFRDRDPSLAGKLILVGRYDGVDLPGDTCRLLVIDDLTLGSGPLERFLWEGLGLSNTLRSSLASRIVQSFGRISRGMSDHGVIILTGKKLVDWLLIPRNAEALPTFLRKQIRLGYEVSRSVETRTDLARAVDACLGRETDWTDTYGGFMRDNEIKENQKASAELVDVALAEAGFMSALWRRDYADAVRRLTPTLSKAFEISTSTGAWHCLWLGYAHELAGDLDVARNMYRRSHGAQQKIPGMPTTSVDTSREDVPTQVAEMALQIDARADGRLMVPTGLHADLALLNGSGSVPQTEEALRCLGQYLGFESSRPDKEFGTGPDVLWIVNATTALCMEAKTGKSSGHYKKEEVAQLGDHVHWVQEHAGVKTIVPVIVGPLLPATSSANPGPDVLVVELSEFASLGTRLVAGLGDAVSRALPITLRSVLRDVLDERELLWPAVFGTMIKTRLRDLS